MVYVHVNLAASLAQLVEHPSRTWDVTGVQIPPPRQLSLKITDCLGVYIFLAVSFMYI